MAHTNRFGLVDQDISQFDRSQGRREQLQNLLAQTQSGVQRGSAATGFAIGSGISKLVGKLGFLKSKETKTAEEVTDAQGRAQTVLKSTPKELRETGPFRQAVQEREILVEELKASGLDEEADTVRGQILALMEQEQKFAKLSGEVTLQDEKKTRSRLETEQRQRDLSAKDETTRLVNELQVLDISDPEQAARADFITSRLDKITTVTGTTEFDVPFDKVTVRAVDAHLGETSKTLNGFTEARGQFTGEFLTLGTKMTNFAVSAVEIAGLDLPSDVKDELRKFTQFKQITSANKNAYIKLITGAQMSEAEAKRLANDVPTINDSPTQYKAKLDQQIKILSAIREQDLAALAVSDDPDKFRRVRTQPLSDFFERSERSAEDELNREADEILTRLEGALGAQ